jgi:hypothetical protein
MAKKFLETEMVYLLGTEAAANTTANAESHEYYVGRYIEHTYQWSNAGAAAVITIEVSVDGVNWVTLATPSGASGIARISGAILWIRAKRDNTTNAVRLVWASKDYAE